MTYLNEKELASEFTKRARMAQLEVGCVGSGATNTGLAIVSDYIGDREEKMKMPFVGGAGQTLWRVLGDYGIHRKDAYCTNVVKRNCGTSSKVDGKISIPRPELEHWEGLLDWELDCLSDLKYILVLGGYALKAVTGQSGITDWRGSVFQCTVGRDRRIVTVICSFNPAHISWDSRAEPLFKFDLHKLKLVMNGDWHEYKISPIINPSPTEAIDYIDRLHDELSPISIDIETMAGETACIGLTNDAHEGMCINFRDATSNRYSITEEVLVRRRIQRLLDDRALKFVAQNGNFDSYWLWYKDRLRVHKIWFDTLLAHHTLYPRMLHNLGFLTSQYTTHPYYKDEAKTWREGGNINQYWEYNVKDICITLYAQQCLLKELRDQSLEDFFFNHVMRLNPHLVAATVTGVKVDTALKDIVAEELEHDVERKRREFQGYVDRLIGPRYDDQGNTKEVNPNSNQQLRKLFFDELKLVGRGTSTDKLNRERIKKHPGTSEEARELLIALDIYKIDQKFHSTYATSRIDVDGRFRPEWKQFGTKKAPGRLSSSQNMWGTAQNMQNQPVRAYKMYIADPGWMFSYFDLSQAEARVVAYLWRVKGLIETFESADKDADLDVHRANASRIFQVPYSDIPKYDRNPNGTPSRRFLGKKCVHGLNYRMAPPRLAEECDIPLGQAHEAYHAYHRVFPEIRKAWEETVREVRNEHMLFNCLGRRMIFMERLDEHSMDSVIAFKPQSTIGDKVSSVIYKCHEDSDWPSNEARILINIHDALIALHRPSVVHRVQAIMRTYAEEPIIIRGQPIVIPADIKESVPDKDGVHRWSTIGESIEMGGADDV